MSFGDTRKKVLEHLSLNTDGFWTNVPLQLDSQQTTTRYFTNANELAKKMKVMEREVVEALMYKKPLGSNIVAIDQRFWKMVTPLTSIPRE